ncbi:MAG: SPOR domain-containing protein [Alphaproteobacteria bacterium]|nr:SPOR domain-containing protein [Alphaproteobacteria bacterium]MBV9815436.1 SPOR domain-containing protein [Alphaproteobacteria bacterium]
MSYQFESAGSDAGTDFYAEPRDRGAGPRFRGLLVSFVAVLSVAVFAGGLWFAYHQGLRHGGALTAAADVPLIRADERPTKVKPENPGGMEVPDRDKLIYTQKRAAVEHLLPPPEKPMARPGASTAATASDASQPRPGSAALNAAANVSPGPPAQAPGKPGQVAPSTGKSAVLQKPGGSKVQLGTVHSEEAARQEWDRIKRANPDLLGSISVTPVRAESEDKGTLYRLVSGPIADAERLCGELKRRNVGCFIVR